MNDVLLVDDERSVLENLVGALDWMEYGFKRIHTAANAAEAMRILRQHSIDLLISDILMPDMTGLEMLKAVRAQYPATHCVLVSAHSKFEYAKEALLMGVENYLLKPLDMSELRDTVYATAENIRRTVRITDDLFGKNILERWLYGRITMDELVEHSRYTTLNVFLKRYRALLVSVEGDPAEALRGISERLSVDLVSYTLPSDAHTGILLAGGREADGDVLRDAAAHLLAEDPTALIVCGSLATGNGEVAQSLLDAKHTMKYAQLCNLRGWIGFDGINWNLVSGEQLSSLGDILRLPPPLPEAHVREWVSGVAASMDAPAALRGIYAQICLSLPRVLTDSVYSDTSAEFASFTPPYTLKHLTDMVLAAIAAVEEHNSARLKGLSPITKRVIGYIAENLNGAVSIKKFCEQTHMNANYIGRLFKDETGAYFSDYVCLTRINKAKLLLETTNLSISNIARQVGMYDVSYFTRCFRKQERLSPMKYRQSLQKGG